jgi:serine/threonine-protein kinase HipA
VHEFFRLEKEEAALIVKQIKKAVSNWRRVATNYGISKASQGIKAPAFQAVE